MKTAIFRFFPSLFLGSLLLSCNPDVIFVNDGDGLTPETKLQVDPKLVYKTPSTPQEIELTLNLGKVSETIKSLYKDKRNSKIVHSAIAAKVYTDESILLSDLIYPENSRLFASDRFQKFLRKQNLDVKYFTDNFWKEVNLTNDEAYKKFLAQIKQPYYSSKSKAARSSSDTLDKVGPLPSEITAVSIYSPYSHTEPIDYEVPGPDDAGSIYAISTATSDADQGIGYVPIFNGNTFSHYNQILIDDNYCEINPTHIIGVNGIEPWDFGSPVGTAFPPSGPITTPGLPRAVKQVYIGDVRVRRQYDKLISFTGNGGGSEMVFTRSDGYLKVTDGQVQADTYHTSIRTVSRKDIKKANWISFSLEWDPDWEADNTEENFAIYEDDNRNSSEFSGSLQTTVKINNNVNAQVGPIGFKITYKSDDSIIKQTNLKRDVFFVLNRTDLEGEMRNGWPVRDKGADVSYTFNDRTLQP